VAKPTYWELLRHPNWQRMRLEVMQRDGFTCVVCLSTDKTLNVHHAYYEKGCAPWEYPPETLKTLCEDCHKATHDVLADIKKQVGSLPAGYLLQIYGYTSAAYALLNLDTVIAVAGYDMVCGIANYLCVNPKVIEASVIDGQIDGNRLQDIQIEEIMKEPK